MRAWLWPAGLLVMTLAGTIEVEAADRTATTKRAGAPEAVDAEMLRDLDLLSSPDYTRDREVARRMGLLNHQLLYGDGPAGYVTTLLLWRRERQYRFMPYRSPAHLRLSEALHSQGSATATIHFWGRHVPVVVTGMSMRRITLHRPPAP